MDPLSDVLSLLNARGVLSARLIAGGDWCIQSPAYEGVRFGALLRGSCQLILDGFTQAIVLQAGDGYLLTDGRPYRIGSDLALPAVDMRDVLEQVVDGVAYCGNRPDVQLLGGRFLLEGYNARYLLDDLPPVIHIPGDSDEATVQRWVLERMSIELATKQAGLSAMVDNLAHIMVVQMLRDYLAAGGHHGGWLAALNDDKLGRVLTKMHESPMRHWTVEELASLASMSRSAFASRFSGLVGTSPLNYLIRWRMRLAARALVQSSASVSAIAYAHGYESESAFSNAFKRVMGSAPRTYRVHASRTTG
jgi:AraC-like DNA-binding protein